MAKTSNDEKLLRVEIAWNTICSHIKDKTPFKWQPLTNECKLTWNSGAQSLRAILKLKLGIIYEIDGGVYEFTEDYRNRYWTKTSGEMATIILRQIDAWIVTPIKKQEDGPKLTKYEPIARSLDLTQLQAYALHEVLSSLNSGRQHSPAVLLIISEVTDKLV